MMPPSAPRRSAAPLRALVLSALLALAGCGGSQAVELPPIEAYGGLTSLLALEGRRTVQRENEAYPVVQNLIKPRGSGNDDFGLLPAIEVTPPCQLEYDVPALHPRAVLNYAVCVMKGGYAGHGEVTVEVGLDGEKVATHKLSCDGDLDPELRKWYRFSLPIGQGGKLQVRTSYDGDQPGPPRVGLGLLKLEVPFSVPRRPARAGQHNVVLILIDTLRADRLSSYGYGVETSPSMDALAARGVRYDHAYSSSPWTIPSTASVLTGMSPPEHGLGFTASYYLADSITTLAETFQAAGFTTGGIATNPLISPSRNFTQGFESFEVTNWSKSFKVDEPIEAWLRANVDKQFFYYIHYTDPHYPYLVTDESRAAVGAREEPADLLPNSLANLLPKWYADPSQPVQPLLDTNAYHSKLYDAQIMDVDRSIGRVLALLAELGVADNTIVAVTSDHGEEFLDHGWSGHHAQLYDESVRVPLMLAGPGVPVGETAEVRVENRWLGGTLLRAVGVDVPAGFDGPDLLRGLDALAAAPPAVFQSNSQGWSANLAEHRAHEHGMQHAVLQDDWRLIWRNDNGRDVPEMNLYDLSRDPGSLNDLSQEQPERVEALRMSIRHWIDESSARRPELVPATAGTTELLKGIGYIQGDEGGDGGH
ncbi:MAG: sulfatase [Planctomycetes bacterium]|nr:sulfatase [Planctomycetota bacterium]